MNFSSWWSKLGLAGPATQHGSASWGKPKSEWLKLGRALRSNECRLAPGAFFVGLYRRKQIVIPRIEAARHGLIVGGSGTGKSRGFFLPNLAWNSSTSLVCTDPKSELWEMTSGFHCNSVRFAPTEPEASACFNWIPLCVDPSTAEMCARAVVESGNSQGTEQAWLDMEAAYLAAVFAHAATTSEPTPLTAYRFITGHAIESQIKTLFLSPSRCAREQAMIFSQTQERMRGSIVPVVSARLQFLRDEKIARFTSASLEPPKFEELRQRPCALFWCMKEHDLVRLRPLTSLFYTLLLERLATGDQHGGGVPVTMLLDEYANAGIPPGFETTIALARGRGVSLWLGLQSLSQLEGRHGKANAQTILANCGTKIALAGLDIDSAEYFSRALGEHTVEVHKKSRQGTFSPSFSFSKAENARRLLTADEVRRIDARHAIVIIGNQPPMLVQKLFYDQPKRAAFQSALGKARAKQISTAQQGGPPPVPALFKLDRPRSVANGPRAVAQKRTKERSPKFPSNPLDDAE